MTVIDEGFAWYFILFFLQNLQINTHFDAKEKMSRNYAGAIGSYSEPVLIYQLVAGSTVSNVTVLWLDPTQSLLDVSEISLDETPGVRTEDGLVLRISFSAFFKSSFGLRRSTIRNQILKIRWRVANGKCILCTIHMCWLASIS